MADAQDLPHDQEGQALTPTLALPLPLTLPLTLARGWTPSFSGCGRSSRSRSSSWRRPTTPYSTTPYSPRGSTQLLLYYSATTLLLLLLYFCYSTYYHSTKLPLTLLPLKASGARDEAEHKLRALVRETEAETNEALGGF